MQQARNVCYDLAERSVPAKFLIRDRDTKFSTSFDSVFAAQGIRVIKSPHRSAPGKRLRRAVRRPGPAPVLGRSHLEVVLAEYVEHYNRGRPHRSLDQRSPRHFAHVPVPITDVDAVHLRRTDVIGGLIHEYHLAA